MVFCHCRISEGFISCNFFFRKKYGRIFFSYNMLFRQPGIIFDSGFDIIQIKIYKTLQKYISRLKFSFNLNALSHSWASHLRLNPLFASSAFLRQSSPYNRFLPRKYLTFGFWITVKTSPPAISFRSYRKLVLQNIYG